MRKLTISNKFDLYGSDSSPTYQSGYGSCLSQHTSKTTVTKRGVCYIKNTVDNYKKYLVEVRGKDLYCFKDNSSEQQEKADVFHYLQGCFVELGTPVTLKNGIT